MSKRRGVRRESTDENLIEKFFNDHEEEFEPEERGWLRKLFAKNRERLRS